MIRTRFPPEPNGYLHLGHLKSMYHNFGYPYDTECEKECYLRFDDTNPKTEKQEYVNAILQDMEWLGYTPDKVTYTSDYFDDIYKFTLELINRGLAYVDLSPPEEIKRMRNEKIESPYREKDITWNLEEFQKMRAGEYPESGAVLRLKIPVEERTNECMIDPIAYRIILAPHYRTLNTWKIYPSYEYSHYIVDSLQGITHSFCTLEFYIRRPLSLWICHQLNLTPPLIQETNRLKTDFGTLSKRKVKAMLEGDSSVSGWDDPRLLTISAFRKKGLTPAILKSFCSQLGYTSHDSAITPLHKLESCIRQELNLHAPRRMMVQDPLPVKIVNYSPIIAKVDKPAYPASKGDDIYSTFLNDTLYLEREDFRKEANKKYKRLAPGRTVRIKYAGWIKYVSHEEDASGKVASITVEHIPEGAQKEKVWGTLHWVSYPSEKEKESCSIPCYTYSYPNDDKPEGELNITSVLLDWVKDTNSSTNYQMERLGYYHYDSSKNNLTYLCSLKEDNQKNL